MLERICSGGVRFWQVCAFGRCALLTGVWMLKERVSLFTPPAYLIDRIVLKTGGVSMKKKH
jgi:hypothetical protein